MTCKRAAVTGKNEVLGEIIWNFQDWMFSLKHPPVVRSTDSEMSGFKRFSGEKSGFKEICSETRDLRKFDGILDMENVGFLNRNHILSTTIVNFSSAALF